MIRILLACMTIALVSGTSTAVALDNGSPAPRFTVPAHDGTTVSLDELRGKIVVLEWFNAGCPFVKKHYRNGNMQRLQKEFADKGVVWLMVNSTTSSHKDYLAPEAAAAFIKDNQVTGARMVLDTSGTVGKAYGARTTPHLFIVTGEGTVVYQGAIDDDDSTDGDPTSAQNFVREALTALLAGTPIPNSTTNPYGCSVKYAN